MQAAFMKRQLKGKFKTRKSRSKYQGLSQSPVPISSAEALSNDITDDDGGGGGGVPIAAQVLPSTDWSAWEV
jgi:hypothetical protein